VSDYGSVRIVTHRDVPHDDNLRAEWNALVNGMPRPKIFYTYEWALAVARSYGATLKPLLLAGYSGNRLIGIAALATGADGREVSFLARTTADYCDFICAPGFAKEFIAAVVETISDLRLPEFVLANLPADSDTARLLPAAAHRCGYGQFSRHAYECLRVQFETLQQRQGVRSALLRKDTVQRYENGVAKLGRVEFRHLTSIEDIGSALPELFEAHVARFLSTGRISNLALLERRSFMWELTRLLAPSGSVMLTQLTLGDRPVAWNYGFSFARTWSWYQPTFDMQLRQYSPGLYLLARTVQDACERPDVDVVDLGLGSEPYKQRLANDTRHTLHVTVSKSGIVLGKAAVRYKAAAAVRKSARLDLMARRFSGRAFQIASDLQRDGLKQSAYRAFSRLRPPKPEEEIVFFEFLGSLSSSPVTSSLRPIDLQLLAAAAMEYSGERETLNYLLRSSAKLSAGQAGFAQVDSRGVPVHFCWLTDFEGFDLAELGCTLRAPCPGSTLLVDYWTRCTRGSIGEYGAVMAGVASRVQTADRPVWVYASATDAAALFAIESVGFCKKFSLARKRWTGRVERLESQAVPEVQASAACAD